MWPTSSQLKPPLDLALRRFDNRAMAQEVNFDGLVGPSHHYGGVAFGNIASQTSEGDASSPKRAALQGLEKMRLLRELGVPQAVVPPHMRPELGLAERMGFVGDTEEVLQQLASELPLLLAACYAASSMWTANAATVCPSADSGDGKLHFTPANLHNKIHRSIEPPTTARILRAVFADAERFEVHQPLPATAALGDEGAANHSRFAPDYGVRGVQLFVYGENAAEPWQPKPQIFPARHTREACLGVSRLHRVPADSLVIAQQNPDVIDQGVFHNDVICVGDRDVLLVHERAFVDTEAVLSELRRKYEATCEGELRIVRVREDDVPVPTAVSTYLFNSQIVQLPSGQTALIAPEECREHDGVRQFVESLVESDSPIDEVHFIDLRESMRGGGGPACLRLRVVLTDEELGAMRQGVLFTQELDDRLVAWVEKHYRDRLLPPDLADPALVRESEAALDELTSMLDIGSIYPFQMWHADAD